MILMGTYNCLDEMKERLEGRGPIQIHGERIDMLCFMDATASIAGRGQELRQRFQ